MEISSKRSLLVAIFILRADVRMSDQTPMLSPLEAVFQVTTSFARSAMRLSSAVSAVCFSAELALASLVVDGAASFSDRQSATVDAT